MSVGESINVTGPCFIRSAGNAACVSHIAHGTGKSSRPSPRRVLRRNSVNALITIIKKNFIQHPEFPSPAAVGSNSCSWCSCVGLLRCRAWRVYERKYEGGGTNGVENGRRKEREREGEREREKFMVCMHVDCYSATLRWDRFGRRWNPPPPFTSPNIHPRSSLSVSFALSRNIHRFVRLSAYPPSLFSPLSFSILVVVLHLVRFFPSPFFFSFPALLLLYNREKRVVRADKYLMQRRFDDL